MKLVSKLTPEILSISKIAFKEGKSLLNLQKVYHKLNIESLKNRININGGV
jgi:hypothetical protein